MSITKEELIDFESEVKQMFLDGKLRSPVHLSGGNEEELIEVFQKLNIRKEDWLFTTYRSHYHALLKGVPKEVLKQWVLDNRSIHFMSKDYKVFSSAIVGGMLPISLGVAMALKRRGAKEKVYTFIGDMTASLGVYTDCFTYAITHDLPIHFVIEDNGRSTDTITSEVWNYDVSSYLEGHAVSDPERVSYYRYTRTYPHYGVGKFVKF